MNGAALLTISALAVVAATTVLLEVRTGEARGGPQPVRDVVDAEEEDAGVIAWCADGLTPINGGGCFAAPAGAHATPLLIYLHGIYDRRADSEELDRQRRVAKLATEHGFAVLALRGVEGGCSMEPELATKYCWPSNERTASRGPEAVSAWQPSLRAAARLGAGGPRYVLGFSNGGFFAGLLAVRDWFSAEAFAVGNAGPVEPVHALGAKPPLLLMSADDDASLEGMLRLDDELTREGWRHEAFTGAGTHELTDHEIEAALAFFARVGGDKGPASPGLPLL
jgi:poly(3-hydroxybutyrate) depolymerase